MLDNVLASEQAPSEFIYDVLKGYHNSAPWYTHGTANNSSLFHYANNSANKDEAVHFSELSARLNWLRWENLGMV